MCSQYLCFTRQIIQALFHEAAFGKSELYSGDKDPAFVKVVSAKTKNLVNAIVQLAQLFVTKHVETQTIKNLTHNLLLFIDQTQTLRLETPHKNLFRLLWESMCWKFTKRF